MLARPGTYAAATVTGSVEVPSELAGAATLTHLLRGLLALGSLGHIAVYVFIAARRLTYPFGLEWMEGGSLEHVARLLEGRPLYIAPTLDFTPFIYTPLYYWVCAPVMSWLGTGLPALRAVSVVASIGVLILLFSTVRARTGDRFAGLVAVGLFTASFEVCGAWLDLARVDSLFLCCLMGAIYLLVRSDRQDAWAGLLLGLAFMTKQTALIVALPLIASRAITQQGSRRLHASVAFGTSVLASSLALDYATGGWFGYYVFDLPHAHPWVKTMRADHFRLDLFPAMPFAATATLYALLRPMHWRARLLLCAAGAGLLLAGWLSRLHSGGFTNVLLPSVLFLAWASAEALHTWTKSGAACSTRLFALLLGCLQLAVLCYDPTRHIPVPEDQKAGMALIARLRTVQGAVLAPHDPLLARLSGKRGSAHEQALSDVFLGGAVRRDASDSLRRGIQQALREKRYAAIVLNGNWWTSELQRSYRRMPRPPLPRDNAMMTRSGMRTRPAQIWIPKP